MLKLYVCILTSITDPRIFFNRLIRKAPVKTALQVACHQGHIKIVQRLQAAGAKLCFNFLCSLTSITDPRIFFNRLIRKAPVKTALQAACHQGHIEIVQLLLAAGAKLCSNFLCSLTSITDPCIYSNRLIRKFR